MKSNNELTAINADNATGIDGLDNMERTVLKMFSPARWHHPLPKSAADALIEIKAKLIRLIGDGQTAEGSDSEGSENIN